MISTNNNKRVANAAGGKTARACDSCIKKRARWYCAADDAFLCQGCDSFVHSANLLARRHERVRLKTASLNSFDLLVSKVPSWHQGFTRKARTPRHGKPSKTNEDYSSKFLGNQLTSLVPEVGSDDQLLSHEENEDDQDQQLLYRVPIFDPFLAELCDNSNRNTNTNTNSTDTSGIRALSGDNNSNHDQVLNGKGGLVLFSGGVEGEEEDQEEVKEEGLKGFLESDMDLVNFAADVESLLGRGLEDESSVGMEELGLAIGCKEEKEVVHYLQREQYCCILGSNISDENNKVKLEEGSCEEEGERANKECEADLERGGGVAPFELSFDYGDNESAETCGVIDEEEDDKKVIGMGVEREFKNDIINGLEDGANDKNKKRSKKRMREIVLKLDYEAVISAWGSQGGSPWTTGSRPDFDPNEYWPDFFGTCGTELQQAYVDHTNGLGGGGFHQAMTGDGGREARVSRYREKRRTRLFSKKIRYEVRKLNAEKRPRMKGRFVKRATYAGPGGFPLLK